MHILLLNEIQKAKETLTTNRNEARAHAHAWRTTSKGLSMYIATDVKGM